MFLNISELHKCFIWTTPKTASRTAEKIFSNFDFDCYEIIQHEKIFNKKGYKHNHTTSFFSGHENYKFLMTVRNPYRMVLSGLHMYTKDEVRVHLEKEFTSELNFAKALKQKLQIRKPDFVLRIEDLINDYRKVPFIEKSEYNRNGNLEKFLNQIHGKNFNYSWEKLIDKDVADLIYYGYSFYFDMFGYEKNSWK